MQNCKRLAENISYMLQDISGVFSHVVAIVCVKAFLSQKLHYSFHFLIIRYAPVTQGTECLASNQKVGGSNPSRRACCMFGLCISLVDSHLGTMEVVRSIRTIVSLSNN